MTILVNYSHPLSEAAKDIFANNHYAVHQTVSVPVQVDLNGNLSLQAHEIVARTLHAVPNPLDIDMIIPPGHAAVAVLVVKHLLVAGAKPRMVVMVSNGNLPPQYVPGGVYSI